MPSQKRHKTEYPGVYYIQGQEIGTGKPEKIFYIMYRKDGQQVHEKAGRQRKDAMTAARAAKLRTDRMKISGFSNRQKREQIQASLEAEARRWTVDKLYGAPTRKPGRI